MDSTARRIAARFAADVNQKKQKALALDRITMADQIDDDINKFMNKAHELNQQGDGEKAKSWHERAKKSLRQWEKVMSEAEAAIKAAGPEWDHHRFPLDAHGHLKARAKMRRDVDAPLPKHVSDADKFNESIRRLSESWPKCKHCGDPVDDRDPKFVHHYWTEQRECLDENGKPLGTKAEVK